MGENISVVLLADDEQALVPLCGISLLERSLRILQRLGFDRVTILSLQPEPIQASLAAPSWARAEISVTVLPRQSGAVADGDEKMTLLLRADIYHDPRLLRALREQPRATLLVDPTPPTALLPLLARESPTAIGYACGAALMRSSEFAKAAAGSAVFTQLADTARASEMKILEVGDLPSYLVDLRRTLRPVWFPAPMQPEVARAENFLLDAAQNGTLDLPAKVHAPIETWIVARLCRTPITPNQITLFTAVVSAVVTILFFSGHLFVGTVLALAVGVLDGLDGKQARVKVETTPLGKREHALDFVLELSWWTALAFHFASTQQLPNAFLLLALLLGSDLVDRVAKAVVKKKTARNLDDLAPIDRVVRLIGGRRNIYIWMFAACLALGVPDQAFVALCWWGAGTAAVHVLRAVWISGRHRLPE